MMSQKLMSLLLAALFLVAPLSGLTARADEGMWPFNQVPREEIKRKYGFEITDEWLKKAQMASVRFPNGSGSFVSPDGLVLTNYHIIEDEVGKLSTAERDYAKTGFVARSREQELKLPGYELNQLVSIEDVTERANAAVKSNMSAADAAGARRAAISQIEAESTKATGLKSDVVTLYQGGRYNIYRYKKYTDVRLVFAPEFQAAFFGGDPDNFNFPRFNIDMGLVRVYENDQPLKVDNYFKWSKAGAKEGDLVFVSGHPGSTERLNTVAHLEFLRDTGLPLTLRSLERRRDMLKKYMAGGEEQTRRAQSELNSVENSIKVVKGRIDGLQDASLLARKQQEEAALQKAVMSDPKRRAEYGDAWEAISTARKGLAAYERDRRMLELAAAFNTPLFNYARTLVRLAEESEKANEKRLPEFTDARRSSLESGLYSSAPIYTDFEKLKLADSLGFMREVYGEKHPLVKKVLMGKTPEARAAELIDGTKLKDVEFRKQLVAGGKEAIAAANDPLIGLARSIDAEARASRKRYEEEVISVERAAYGKIARALFEKEGTSLYPDATFTLRLSYGAVKCYMENGKQVPWFTTLGGLYERSMKFNQRFPYNLPSRWIEEKDEVELKTPFNIVSTNDIIGGNSGSPLFNKDLELVGLVFDGNIQSLVGNFYYDEAVNRTISVDSRGMLEVLGEIFDAERIVDELD
ncbi:S46 family peptidase [soil metagenome]